MSSNKVIDINLKEGQYFEIDRFVNLSDIFIIKGGRGLGKTYSCLKHFMNTFTNEGRPFIYCRLHDDEFKGLIGSLCEIINAEDALIALDIDFDREYGADYVRGRPAKTVSIRYVDSISGKREYLIVAYLCDIYKASKYKGFAPEPGKEPLHFMLDEFTNGINMFTGDVELKLLDLIETFYRTRDYKIYLLTNNNNENNAFSDLFNEFCTIRIRKPARKLTNNVKFNNYLDGIKEEYNDKYLELIGYYYITSRDIIGLYKHSKLGSNVIKQESFSKYNSLAKKDPSIFKVDAQFLDDWSENVFRLAKKSMHNLYG